MATYARALLRVRRMGRLAQGAATGSAGHRWRGLPQRLASRGASTSPDARAACRSLAQLLDTSAVKLDELEMWFDYEGVDVASSLALLPRPERQQVLRTAAAIGARKFLQACATSVWDAENRSRDNFPEVLGEIMVFCARGREMHGLLDVIEGVAASDAEVADLAWTEALGWLAAEASWRPVAHRAPQETTAAQAERQQRREMLGDAVRSVFARAWALQGGTAAGEGLRPQDQLRRRAALIRSLMSGDEEQLRFAYEEALLVAEAHRAASAHEASSAMVDLCRRLRVAGMADEALALLLQLEARGWSLGRAAYTEGMLSAKALDKCEMGVHFFERSQSLRDALPARDAGKRPTYAQAVHHNFYSAAFSLIAAHGDGNLALRAIEDMARNNVVPLPRHATQACFALGAAGLPVTAYELLASLPLPLWDRDGRAHRLYKDAAASVCKAFAERGHADGVMRTLSLIVDAGAAPDFRHLRSLVRAHVHVGDYKKVSQVLDKVGSAPPAEPPPAAADAEHGGEAGLAEGELDAMLRGPEGGKLLRDAANDLRFAQRVEKGRENRIRDKARRWSRAASRSAALSASEAFLRLQKSGDFRSWDAIARDTFAGVPDKLEMTTMTYLVEALFGAKLLENAYGHLLDATEALQKHQAALGAPAEGDAHGQGLDARDASGAERLRTCMTVLYHAALKGAALQLDKATCSGVLDLYEAAGLEVGPEQRRLVFLASCHDLLAAQERGVVGTEVVQLPGGAEMLLPKGIADELAKCLDGGANSGVGQQELVTLMKVAMNLSDPVEGVRAVEAAWKALGFGPSELVYNYRVSAVARDAARTIEERRALLFEALEEATAAGKADSMVRSVAIRFLELHGFEEDAERVFVDGVSAGVIFPPWSAASVTEGPSADGTASLTDRVVRLSSYKVYHHGATPSVMSGVAIRCLLRDMCRGESRMGFVHNADHDLWVHIGNLADRQNVMNRLKRTLRAFGGMDAAVQIDWSAGKTGDGASPFAVIRSGDLKRLAAALGREGGSS